MTKITFFIKILPLGVPYEARVVLQKHDCHTMGRN